MAVRTDRTWVEISRSAIRHNLQLIQDVIGDVMIAPVVKANAYGHSAFGITDVLKREKIWGVCVAYGSEALALRKHGWKKRILVLSYWDVNELHELIRSDIDLVVWNKTSIQNIINLPVRLRQNSRVHIKLETGTSRIGFSDNNIPDAIQTCNRHYLKIIGLFSHLANSEEAGTVRTKKQIHRFTTLLNTISYERGTVVHLACTAAALRYPEARFGLVRPGIGLYGLWPSEATERLYKANKQKAALKPVLTWKSRFSQVKKLPAGTYIGYGSTVRLSKAALIGTIPVGYSDGYRRDWSNKSWVMVRGRRAPVIGRVSMNLLMVNLQNTIKPKVDDEVTLLGDGISADDLADLANTINYEVTTGISPLIPRYVI